MDTKTKRYIIVAASVVVTLSAFLVAVLYSASKNGVNVPVKAAAMSGTSPSSPPPGTNAPMGVHSVPARSISAVRTK